MGEPRPPAARSLPPGRLELRKEHLISELNVRAEGARRRRRRLTLIAVPAVLLLLAATGFTTYVLTREPTHFESLGCFDRASLDANVTVVSSDGRHPVAICRELWRGDAMSDAATPKKLTACVLESGAIGVFPGGRDTCGSLGLAALPPSYAHEARKFAALRDALTERLGKDGTGSSLPSGPCVAERRAHAIVREELNAHGYAHWSIETATSFTGDRPCASVAFDGAEEVVHIVPVDRRAP